MELPSDILAIMPCVMDFLDSDESEIFAAANLSLDIDDTSVLASVLLGPTAKPSRPDSLKDPDKQQQSESSINFMSFSGEEFQQKFRMCQTTFWELLSTLKKHNSDDTIKDKGKNKEDRDRKFQKNVLMTLHYLGSQKSIQEISLMFHVAESDVWCSINSTIDSLYELMQYFISWPSNSNQEDYVSKGFENICKIPGALGALDSTHICCTGGRHMSNQFYVNAHGKPSIILQAVCDHTMRFLHCCTGWPGTLDNASVLHDSDLFHDIVEKHSSSCLSEDSFLIGDKDYPLYKWLITPFIKESPACLNDHELQFNFCHSLALDTISKAFLHLKRRFPRLKCLDAISLEYLVKAVLVSCALHNLCLDQGENVLFKDFNVLESGDTVTKARESISTEDGLHKRKILSLHLQSLLTK